MTQLTPEAQIRLLRAKAAELETSAAEYLGTPGIVRLRADSFGAVLADIALVASMLADHIGTPAMPRGD